MAILETVNSDSINYRSGQGLVQYAARNRSQFSYPGIIGSHQLSFLTSETTPRTLRVRRIFSEGGP